MVEHAPAGEVHTVKDRSKFKVESLLQLDFKPLNQVVIVDLPNKIFKLLRCYLSIS